ncbi:hypothetical protein E5676_scaffold637G00320 [Cucumis melo var. makuwa]|uniref:Uncharacterized protein n=1 Tax=Cucumis melo var. makuwa TaxID=1194695 RepID=A0A5D3CZH9_CUCMM|nr:hypothetical protein E5676_scaffold637G00320 [Cucumis melo var. makuwa]
MECVPAIIRTTRGVPSGLLARFRGVRKVSLTQAKVKNLRSWRAIARDPWHAIWGHSSASALIYISGRYIKGNRHSVLSLLADGPYVKDDPQVHIVEEEWEQMADIARVCLEEASRPMEERVDQKKCPLEFEWMTKFLINGATTSYDYLSTWNRREIHKFLVKWKKPLVEVTSGEHVEDLEVWTQKTKELQLRQLTRTSTV